MDRKVIGAVVVAIVLGTVGCGGSGSLSKAELVKRANAICKTTQAEAQTVFRKAPRNSPGTVRTRLGSVIRRMVREFRTLKPSGNVKATYDRYVTELAVGYEAATRTGTPSRADAARQRQASTAAGRYAKQLGITSC